MSKNTLDELLDEMCATQAGYETTSGKAGWRRIDAEMAEVRKKIHAYVEAALQFNLAEDRAVLLRDTIGGIEKDEEPAEVTFIVGPGHSGHGLYVVLTEHPEEGAIFLSTVVKRKTDGPGTCKWREDCDGKWDTDCENAFVFNDGGPKDNGAKFCCYCGREVEEVKWNH